MTRTGRLRCALVLSGLLASLMPLAGPATADDGRVDAPSLSKYDAVEQRSTAYLCTGYVACAEAGYSHAGYRTAADTMWWRMYTGHNCTNYVAYRMVKSGLPNDRPWSGGGNASEWGLKMAGITDDVPIVGAVAWWRANAPGTGSSGHVAYVEEVISSTVIVISEDSWSGDFHWRKIRKADGRWPSGFVHFNDQVITNVAAPVIEGTPKVGAPLTAAPGTWTPAGSYAFQWLVDGAVIPGATAAQYVPTAAQRGKRLTLQVTATKKGYAPGTARKAAPSDVVVGDFRSAEAPTVSGVAEVDQVLTATPGSWAPTPESASVQWYADGVAIPGATSWQLRLGQPQIDKRVTAAVTVRATGYKPRKVSSPETAPVIAGTIAITSPFSVDGRVRTGDTLTVTPGSFEPADATVTYTWLRDGEPIRGAAGTTYVLRPWDVGSRITVRVDLARTSYRSTSQVAKAQGRVQTKPTLRISSASASRRAVVIVRVGAPGVSSPRGLVTVSIGAKKVTGKVVDGRFRAVVEGLKPGWHKVRVRYTGTKLVLPAAGSDRVYVKR
ncbi:CHAP domain-containing protein [Nocardioides szechwanensis]|uniref:CHAP domain-containing protein n=1 Tax=Nocardioides szechwanensis TaxID=1005944 RepID=UPI00115FC37C|nr:CHAP domain-containing protein [Nocardioides szechwanensis]